MITWKVPAIAAVAFGLGIVGGATFAKQGKLEYTMVPAGTAKFAPVDPKQPNGVQLAVLSGDPKTGPTAFLLKLPKGAAPMHWHSSDYYAFTVEGQSKHWLPGKEAEAKVNGPGTFWLQPGGSAATTHGDECLTDSCTVFLYMPGKFDFTPAKTDEKKPADKKPADKK